MSQLTFKSAKHYGYDVFHNGIRIGQVRHYGLTGRKWYWCDANGSSISNFRNRIDAANSLVHFGIVNSQ